MLIVLGVHVDTKKNDCTPPRVDVGEDIANIDVGGKCVTKEEFMWIIQFVEVDRTRRGTV